MNKNLYLNIFVAITILLIGYYFSSTATDFWTGRIIGLVTTAISGFSLIGFDLKKIPVKQNYPIRVIYIIAILFGFTGMVLINYFVPTLIYDLLKWQMELEFRPADSELLRFLILAVTWVFLEEIYHRRILAQMIFNKKSLSKAIWISALIFSIAHMFADIGLIYALFGGLALAYVYLKTQSIWLSIIAHLYYNGLTFYGSPKITEHIAYFDSKMKISGMIILGFILVLIMVIIIHRQTKKIFERKKPVGNSA